MNENENKTKQLTIRMHEDRFMDFKEWCYQNRRSMADVTYELIRFHLDDKLMVKRKKGE